MTRTTDPAPPVCGGCGHDESYHSGPVTGKSYCRKIGCDCQVYTPAPAPATDGTMPLGDAVLALSGIVGERRFSDREDAALRTVLAHCGYSPGLDMQAHEHYNKRRQAAVAWFMGKVGTRGTDTAQLVEDFWVMAWNAVLERLEAKYARRADPPATDGTLIDELAIAAAERLRGVSEYPAIVSTLCEAIRGAVELDRRSGLDYELDDRIRRLNEGGFRREAEALAARRADPPATDEHLPCPICRGVEGCDHTIPERARAADREAFIDRLAGLRKGPFTAAGIALMRQVHKEMSEEAGRS